MVFKIAIYEENNIGREVVQRMANVVPEWLTLVLGIAGTTTGILALIIYAIRLRREKPHLKISFKGCFHTYNPNPEQVWKLVFRPQFLIDNIGDRGTTVNKVELLFKINNKEYTIFAEGSSIVDAHSTVDVSREIYSYDEAIQAFREEEKIKCVFILFHTHGKETIEGTSEMVV